MPLAGAAGIAGKDNLTRKESDKLIDIMTKGKRDVYVADVGNGLIDRLKSRAILTGKTPEVFAPKDSYILAHELGHATGPMANKYLKYPLHGLYSLAGKATHLRLLDSVQKAYNKEMGYDEKDNSKVLGGLSRLSQLGSAYQLAEEGQATLRGMNAIKKLHGWRGVGRSAAALLPAYGTYALQAGVAHGLAPKVGDWYGKRLAKKEKQKLQG